MNDISITISSILKNPIQDSLNLCMFVVILYIIICTHIHIYIHIHTHEHEHDMQKAYVLLGSAIL